MKKILKDLQEGKISEEEAEKLICQYLEVGGFCKFDLSREHRRGVPEIVLAENKEENKIVHKVVNVILSTIGFIFVIFSISKAFTDLNNILT